MRYKVFYAYTAEKDNGKSVGGKEGRNVEVPLTGSPKDQDVRDAISDVLQETHARQNKVSLSSVEIELREVRGGDEVWSSAGTTHATPSSSKDATADAREEQIGHGTEASAGKEPSGGTSDRRGSRGRRG